MDDAASPPTLKATSLGWPIWFDDDVHAQNVHALVRLGGDVLAFEGLAHLGMDEGMVLRIHRGDAGRWRATTFAMLPGAPEAIAAEPPGR